MKYEVEIDVYLDVLNNSDMHFDHEYLRASSDINYLKYTHGRKDLQILVYFNCKTGVVSKIFYDSIKIISFKKSTKTYVENLQKELSIKLRTFNIENALNDNNE